MILGLGHIGIVVKNIEESLAAISKVLDIPVPPIQDFPEKKKKVAVVDLKGIGLELIQDYSPEGVLTKFLRDGGDVIHHFCLLTNDIQEDIEILKKRGIEMMDQKPRLGLRGKKIAFIKPSVLKGVQMELSEP